MRSKIKPHDHIKINTYKSICILEWHGMAWHGWSSLGIWNTLINFRFEQKEKNDFNWKRNIDMGEWRIPNTEFKVIFNEIEQNKILTLTSTSTSTSTCNEMNWLKSHLNWKNIQKKKKKLINLNHLLKCLKLFIKFHSYLVFLVFCAFFFCSPEI